MKPRLLVIDLHHLGDAVMAMPFLKSALEKYDVWVACLPLCRSIFETLLPPERILTWKAPWSGEQSKYNLKRIARSGLPSFFKEMRWVEADVVVQVWADSRVGWMMRWLAPRRVGFAMTAQNYYGSHLDWRRKQLRIGQILEKLGYLTGGPLLTERLERIDGQQHHMDDWKQIAASLGLDYSEKTPWFELPGISPGASFSQWLEAGRGKSCWLLHPGGRLPTKRWGRFQELCQALEKRSDIVLGIIAPPGEPCPLPAEGQKVFAAASLPELMKMISLVDGLICNDSLSAHLGSAFGVKTISIFGSGNANCFHPRGWKNGVVESFVCPLRPCLDHCPYPSPLCLEDISVERVLEKLELVPKQ